jgi:hypothetical protein
VGWQEEVRILELARSQARWGFWIGGEVVEGRECVFDMHISRPSVGAAPDGKPSLVQGGGIIVPPRKVRAVVDTGCTNTAIRYELAAELGLPVVGSTAVETASSGSSPVPCPTVLADLALMDPRNIVIQVTHELVAQDMSDDVLLGMDLLIGGVLTVDMVHLRWDWKCYVLGPQPASASASPSSSDPSVGPVQVPGRGSSTGSQADLRRAE